MKVIRLLHFDFPAKLGGQKFCLTHGAICKRPFHNKKKKNKKEKQLSVTYSQ